MKLLNDLLFSRYMAPLGDDDGAGAGDPPAGDRGDDFTPTDETPDPEIKPDPAPAPDPEADPEADPEKKETPEEKAAKKDTRIPLARHKEMLERARVEREALASQLEKYQKGQQQQVTNADIAAAETRLEKLENDYNKQLADGELEKASATMKQVRLLERSINSQVTDLKMQAVETQAVERVRYDTIVERLEEAYPEINPDSDEFDRSVAAEMVEMSEAFQLKGLSPSAALQKAVAYILKPTTRAQKVATEITPNANKDDVAAATKQLRKEAALDKALSAADKTPPNTAKLGKDSDKAGGGVMDGLQVMKLSQADFDKLDEATLAKFRGDVL